MVVLLTIREKHLAPKNYQGIRERPDEMTLMYYKYAAQLLFLLPYVVVCPVVVQDANNVITIRRPVINKIAVVILY